MLKLPSLLILLFIATAAHASDKVQKKAPPQMKALAEWTGPFDDTAITKYVDYSEGVVCYVYSPRGIGTNISCNSKECQTHFKGDIGSISCVKVGEPLLNRANSK